MATKLYDVAVEVGRYTDNSGQEKKRWKTIGAVWSTQDNQGNAFNFIMLERSFNPAGVPFQDGADSIRCTLFKPKGNNNSPTPQQQRQDFSSDTAGDFGNVDDFPF